MKRISSSATLFFKIFLPTSWIVFFGAFTFAVMISGVGKSPLFGNWIFKLGLLASYLLGLIVLYLTLMRLKRVEIDPEYLYATNYFRAVRYPLVDIERITEMSLIFIHLGSIHLKERGIFGKKILFLQSRQKFADFVKSDPAMSQLLYDDDV